MTEARAAVVSAPGKVAVERFPLPEPGPGAVLLKMRLSGICGTDKHTFRGENLQYAGTPHQRAIEYPLICGHENVGDVVATGGEVRDSEGAVLRVGDRVVPAANVPCGRCRFCLSDAPYYLCAHMEDYGNSLNCSEPPYLFGGWSEYLYLLPRTPIFRVPADLPDRLAVLTEVLAVAHGVESALNVLGDWGGDRFGSSVVVLGVGPLGTCHLVKARLLGAGLVIATDRFPSRLQLACELGATVTFDVGTTDQEERARKIRELTGGYGADIVVDCTGVPESFVEALEIVRPGGVVVEPGAFVDLGPVSVNPNSDICTKNVAVLGIGGERATGYLPSMRLMEANQRRLPLDRIVTHELALEDAEEALMTAQRDGAMQVVLRP
jgi:threonine dehydrogenase-like Zn-dependent dehydrogenase